MEKVLFDIYLADAEVSANYSILLSDSVRKQEFLNSIMKKHKITEAVLDTSLAWYSARLKKFYKINNNISKRYAEATEILRRQEEATTKKQIFSESNDFTLSGSKFSGSSSFVLPVSKEHFMLRISDLSNKFYTFKADTVLDRYGGKYELLFNILGVSASLNPVVTLCVQCTDTAFIKRDTISMNGLFTSSVTIPQGKQAKSIYGSIYFPEVFSGMGIFVQDFTLFYSIQSPFTAQPAK